MKNIYIKIMLLFAITLSISCDYDENEILQGFEEAALPVVSDVSSSYFNFADLATANVAFNVDKTGVPVNSITVLKTYKGKTIVHEEVTNLPAQLNYSIDEVITGFDGLTVDDLQIGDVFTFSFIVNTAEGSSVRSGVSLDAPLSCPSELAGTYTTKTSGSSTDSGPTENPVSDFMYEVTLTPTANDGVYTISDFSGGVYELWYDIYGIGGDTPGTIQDVCNEISFTNTSEPFGTSITGSGSYDPETGIITLTGKNGFDDTWTIEMTPKP